ncbi:MAG: hypothetical protein U1E05_23480 [Patescibacteria group bacterium]|nr:hypothetical protein [Patescibacteria group bacterium]
MRRGWRRTDWGRRRWSLGGGRLAGEDFASSMIRQVLLAVRRLPKARKRPAGRNWLRTEWADDWKNRERLTAILLEQRLSETLI